MKKQYYLKAEEQIEEQVKRMKFTWKDWAWLALMWIIGIAGMVWIAVDGYQRNW